jgi:hypothetical protein
MGEAKRKREAVLNGPCPCGLNKPARLCWFTGKDWYKPPAVLGLKSLPQINYYGNFYRTQLRPTLKRIDAYVIRWARRTPSSNRCIPKPCR